jgi:hypothetical protein
MMAIMADIIASVEPQQIVISRSGFFDDRVAQSFSAPGDGVLVDVVGDGLARGFLDLGGGGEVRESLRKIDGVVFECEARHFANDGLGEFFGFCREHAAGDVSDSHGLKRKV